MLRDLPSRGDRSLVAYYVSRAEVDRRELRAFLSARLLPQTVPETFVHLRRMPLTLNGKINREALPPPQAAPAAPRQDTPWPTATEELVASVFGQVLGLERVGVDDDFFELGGHSLLATQVTSRLRRVFGVDLALRALFEASTVRMLAQRVVRAIDPERMRVTPPLVPTPRGGRLLPLSFAQQRLWFLDQLEPDSTAYTIPFALRLSGPLDAPALERSLGEIVRRHESLRTRFPAVDDHPCQQIQPAVPLLLPLVDVRSTPEPAAAARRLAAQEAARGFDLAHGPLMRVALMRVRHDEHVLLVTMHHAICDGWSVGILIRELTTLYNAYRAGRSSPLPEPSLQYADFAVWQRQWLTGEVLEQQLAYWRERLAGTPTLEIPRDRSQPATSRAADLATMALGPDVSQSLRSFSQRQGVTLFMTLLAALQLALSRWTGQDDIAVGTDVANRNRLETEGIVGFFVNQLVLRTDLAGTPRFGELLMRVRDVTLGAYAHQDVPFEKVVEDIGAPRMPGRSPIVQVKFVLQNVSVEPLAIAGVEVEPLATRPAGGKFDILFNMTDTGHAVRGAMQYDPAVVSSGAARWFLASFEALLSAIATCSTPADVRADVLLADADRRLASVIQQQASTPESAGLVRHHWRMRLRSAPLAMAPVSGSPVPAGRSFAPLRVHIALPPSLVSGIDRTGARAFYLSAWCLLIHRMTRLPEFVVGLAQGAGDSDSPSDGGSVPLRSTMPGDRTASFTTLLSAIAETLTEMEAFNLRLHWDPATGEYPGNGHGLPVCFAYREHGCPPASPGRPAAHDRDWPAHERFVMHLRIVRDADAPAVELWYDSERVSRREAARMVQRYVTLLATVADTPERPVAHVDVLAENERRLVVGEWRRSPWTCDASDPIHRVFEQQVRRSADSVAIIQGAAHLTYDELNRWGHGPATPRAARGSAPRSPGASWSQWPTGCRRR